LPIWFSDLDFMIMSEIRPADVATAYLRLDGIVNRTIVMTSRSLDKMTGRHLFLKCENFQRAGAFKIRGAYNALSQLTEDQKTRGIVTHSSGNHAQGVALAARLLGIEATIVMPKDAPEVKRSATQAYGARIVPCKAIERERVANDLIENENLTLIHPYDNKHIIAGQGTAAWELFDEIGKLDLLFVPVGGGGLISGSALAAAAKCPSCKVIGVEPEIAADAGLSWQSGKVVTLDHVPNTIADGLRTRQIGNLNLTVMQKFVADMIRVSEQEIVDTLKFVWQRLKIVIEPSAAVALAPVFSGKYQTSGERVGVILSGGNVDIADILTIMSEENYSL
jgi:threonine dehydratase